MKLSAVSSIFLAASFAAAQDLKVDPLLVAQASQVWSVIAQSKKPLWPGWNAADTPLLIYLTGKQDLLINHPKPPAGFKPYGGPIQCVAGKMWVRDGETTESMDGQNTSIDLAGVRTLVVSDTAANRRQWIQSLFDVPAGKDRDLGLENGLIPDPYESLALIAHEAFHVFQDRNAPDKGADEFLLTRYPSLSVQNNVEYALEAEKLRESLTATTDVKVREAAIDWLALRRSRQALLGPDLTKYEDLTEFSEGLAKFIEFKLAGVLEGAKPIDALWYQQGFRGFADLGFWRTRHLDQMGQAMSGAMNVNNDLYGASPVRMRLYFSGMGIAALLDKLHAKWQDQILKPDVSLAGLVANTLNIKDRELRDRLAALRNSDRYATLTKQKEELRSAGEAFVQKTVQDLNASKSKIVIDYSEVAQEKIRFGYTPFGILRVDENRTFFKLVPLSGALGLTFRFQDTGGGHPTLQDRSSNQILIGMPVELTEETVKKAFGSGAGEVDLSKAIAINGLRLKGGKARIQVEGNTLTIKVLKS